MDEHERGAGTIRLGASHLSSEAREGGLEANGKCLEGWEIGDGEDGGWGGVIFGVSSRGVACRRRSTSGARMVNKPGVMNAAVFIELGVHTSFTCFTARAHHSSPRSHHICFAEKPPSHAWRDGGVDDGDHTEAGRSYGDDGDHTV